MACYNLRNFFNRGKKAKREKRHPLLVAYRHGRGPARHGRIQPRRFFVVQAASGVNKFREVPLV